jgi:hypothetical protein
MMTNTFPHTPNDDKYLSIHQLRQNLVDRFQNGDIDVLICTFGVGSTGIHINTLTYICTYIYVCIYIHDTCILIYARFQNGDTDVLICTFGSGSTDIHTYVYTCISICIYMIHLCIYMIYSWHVYLPPHYLLNPSLCATCYLPSTSYCTGLTPTKWHTCLYVCIFRHMYMDLIIYFKRKTMHINLTRLHRLNPHWEL